MKVSRKTEEFLRWELGNYDDKVSRRSQDDLNESWRQRSLFDWANEQQNRLCDEAFYEKARSYSDDSLFEHPYKKANILATHHRKFRVGGKQALFDETGRLLRSPGYIGTIFNRVVSGVKKRLDA